MYSQNPWDEQPYEPPRVSRVSAAYQADGLTEQVIVPALKAGILGLSLGILAGLLVWQLRWPTGLHPLMAMGLTWFIVLPISFFGFSQRGMWLIERISGVDLNNDGYRGQPALQQLPLPQETKIIRVQIEQDQGRHVDYLDLPEGVTEETFATFARSVLNGRDLSEGVWGGPGGLWAMPTYRKLRDALVQRRVLRWNNEAAHSLGLTITPAGKAVLRAFAQPPSPRDE